MSGFDIVSVAVSMFLGGMAIGMLGRGRAPAIRPASAPLADGLLEIFRSRERVARECRRVCGMRE